MAITSTSQAFDRAAFSARAKALRHRCPECGSMMRGTGELYWLAESRRWFLAYRCEREDEIFAIWAPETQRLAEEVAADG